MKNKILKLTFICLGFILYFNSEGHCQVISRIATVAQNTQYNAAHWIQPVNPSSALSGACNGIVYMPFEDKEMFAVALTAHANKAYVEFFYIDNAPSLYMPGFNISSTCMVTMINLRYVA